MIRIFTIIFLLVALSGQGFCAESKKKKVQEVSFDGDDVDGMVRQPDGMYLAQKKGIDFVPLYRVRDSFDQNIRDSIEYLR